MATKTNKSGKTQVPPSHVSIDPRHLKAGDVWFDPDWEPGSREKILALLLHGELPDWPIVILPELRISRKLGFHVGDQLIVVAGIGLVQRDRDRVLVSTPQIGAFGSEGTIIHDSYVSRLDLKRDPLGGLSKGTVHLALRRMASARESAGSMAIIPKILAHGTMYRSKPGEMGFLVYTYPANVERPSAWSADDSAFYRGMENMARFLAALHRQGFHGGLYRADQGSANTLWTTDERVIPVVTGWVQYAGLSSQKMMVRDVKHLIEAGIYQLMVQNLHDRPALSLSMARQVLMVYGQLRAAFKQQEFDFWHDPLEGLDDGLDVLADEGGCVERYITSFL
ncbi:MAG: hypothetical protein JXB07_19225 [Anaerolineae bacterium]|nr:hypothetical protein [Anaerolineae bacterium]